VQGYIILVAEATIEAEILSSWTVEWVLFNGVDIEPTVYLVDNLDLAKKSIEVPLASAHPPALVILDHSHAQGEVSSFSQFLRSVIPETWIIDILTADSPVPEDPTVFALFKPIHKENWENILKHVFSQAGSPQWSKAILNS
jgi:hypothetical protein